MSLADNTCVPCRGGVPPLESEKIQELLGQLESGWSLNDQGHIERMYEFSNFADALAFTNRVGNIATLSTLLPSLFFNTRWLSFSISFRSLVVYQLTDPCNLTIRSPSLLKDSRVWSQNFLLSLAVLKLSI